MNGPEFRERRERLLLTQAAVADRLKVSVTTVKNWEAEATAIPMAVEMLWGVWEQRFEQESPHLGPVTLIYTDNPMFVDLQGPRRLAMMQQEAFVTLAGAIARVCALWGQPSFHSPLILKPSGEVLWNAVQLAHVVDGSDTGAPTVPVMLNAIAAYVRAYSARYVRNGPRLPTPSEVETRQLEIEHVADEIEALAAADRPTLVETGRAEAAFDKLHILGMFPPGQLVNGVYHAYVARSLARS